MRRAWGAASDPRFSRQFSAAQGRVREDFSGWIHASISASMTVVFPVLRHRPVTTFNADAEGVTTYDILKRLIDAIPLPQEASAKAVRA
jgi:MoxR-like ATPase